MESMVYDHLRFAYPGAFIALRKAHQSREKRVAKAEQLAQEQLATFSALGQGPAITSPAGVRNTRKSFGKRQALALNRPVAPISSIGPAPRKDPAAQYSTDDPPAAIQAWTAIVAGPGEPTRVGTERDNLSLRLAVDSSYAEGGIQKPRPTAKGHARQILAQHHVAHERAPDGGFFMVSGADGFDIGLIKPHAEKRSNLARVHALTAR